jgi:hypothetical protein
MKVTKWSTFTGDLNVSEQNAEQTSGESGSLSAGSAVPNSSDAVSQPVAAPVQEPVKQSADVGSPDPLPGQTAAAEVDTPKADAPNTEAPKPEAPRLPGKVMIMSSGDRGSGGNGVGAESESGQSQGMFGKRRLSALAAVVALAAVAGALGGALATSGLSHFVASDTGTANNSALEASVARIDSDILALKASIEHSSKLGISEFSKTSDRLGRVEKAQAEPAAKLAELSEAVDKLRAAAAFAPEPVAAASVAVKETTGSIAPPVAAAPVAVKETTTSVVPPAAAAPAAAPKAEVARLPTVEGWVLRDVAYGGALIESRRGVYEVYAGDAVRGLGRVDAIRRQDGRWVVVTSKGLVVAR